MSLGYWDTAETFSSLNTKAWVRLDSAPAAVVTSSRDLLSFYWAVLYSSMWLWQPLVIKLQEHEGVAHRLKARELTADS